MSCDNHTPLKSLPVAAANTHSTSEMLAHLWKCCSAVHSVLSYFLYGSFGFLSRLIPPFIRSSLSTREEPGDLERCGRPLSKNDSPAIAKNHVIRLNEDDQAVCHGELADLVPYEPRFNEELGQGSTSLIARIKPGVVVKYPRYSWWHSEAADSHAFVKDIKLMTLSIYVFDWSGVARQRKPFTIFTKRASFIPICGQRISYYTPTLKASSIFYSAILGAHEFTIFPLLSASPVQKNVLESQSSGNNPEQSKPPGSHPKLAQIFRVSATVGSTFSLHPAWAQRIFLATWASGGADFGARFKPDIFLNAIAALVNFCGDVNGTHAETYLSRLTKYSFVVKTYLIY